MRIKLKEFYDMPACGYSVYIYKTPLTTDEYYSVCDKIRYYSKKTGVSWLCVYSTTEHKNAEQSVIRTGKRGRPKKLITGNKVDGHCHSIIVGTREKSAYSTAHTIKKALNKYFNQSVCKVVSKSDNDHALQYMKYCLEQADIIRSGGDFDFKEHVAKYNYFDNKNEQ